MKDIDFSFKYLNFRVANLSLLAHSCMSQFTYNASFEEFSTDSHRAFQSSQTCLRIVVHVAFVESQTHDNSSFWAADAIKRRAILRRVYRRVSAPGAASRRRASARRFARVKIYNAQFRVSHLSPALSRINADAGLKSQARRWKGSFHREQLSTRDGPSGSLALLPLREAPLSLSPPSRAPPFLSILQRHRRPINIRALGSPIASGVRNGKS